MAKADHTQKHRDGVAAILRDYPGARTTGFAQEARKLWKRLGSTEPLETAFIPDAFRFNEDAQEIEIFEVEVSHPVDRIKLHKLGYWWSLWDAEDGHEWLPVLIQVDRFGDRHRRDLTLAYYDLLQSKAVGG